MNLYTYIHSFRNEIIFKMTKQFFVLFIFTLFGVTTFSQNANEQSSIAIANSFDNKASELNYLANQGFQINETNLLDNGVYVSQAGEGNTIFSNTTAETINLNLIQKGTFNEIALEVTAKDISETVIQDGNDNSFLDFSDNGALFHGAEILQVGNDQNLVWFGNNSIAERLKVTMRGEGKTVTVRNFN